MKWKSKAGDWTFEFQTLDPSEEELAKAIADEPYCFQLTLTIRGPGGVVIRGENSTIHNAQ